MAGRAANHDHGARGRRSTKAPNSGPLAPLIDTNEAAARLGVTPRFIRRLVDERRVPFHKIGKYVRFDPADIDNFVMDSRIEPNAGTATI